MCTIQASALFLQLLRTTTQARFARQNPIVIAAAAAMAAQRLYQGLTSDATFQLTMRIGLGEGQCC